MEAYILTAVCLAAWGATVGLFKFLLMPDSENAFIFGSLVGLLMAAFALRESSHSPRRWMRCTTEFRG